MRRRLVATTVLIALAAVLVLGVPLGVVESRRVRADENARLEREADEVAAAIDDRIERDRRFAAADLAPFVRPGQRVSVSYRGRRIAAGRVAAGETLSGRSGGGRGAMVTVTAAAGDVTRRRREVWLLIALLALAGTAAAAGLALLQARRFARPLQRLTRTSTRLGAGDFSARAGSLGFPEFDRVGEALDASAAQIAQLVGRQREFAANVSHQLRSPLTALRLRLETLESGDGEDVRAALAVADRLERTVTDLLALAGAGDLGEPRDLDLADLARRHADEWSPVFARAGRDLAVSVQGPLAARVSAGGVAQALDVLLDNALRHGGGAIRVRVGAEPGWGTVVVEDDGPGVAHEDRERIFERGATSGAGTGIGLHLARALAMADGGTLRLTAHAPVRLELRLRAFAMS